MMQMSLSAQALPLLLSGLAVTLAGAGAGEPYVGLLILGFLLASSWDLKLFWVSVETTRRRPKVKNF